MGQPLPSAGSSSSRTWRAGVLLRGLRLPGGRHFALDAGVHRLFQQDIDHRHHRDEEDHAQDAEGRAAHQDRNDGPQRLKAHRTAHHMGVDELVLDELHHLVHHQAEQRLQGIHQQDQRHANAAGQECADIRDKSAHRRQNGDQAGIGDAEHRQGRRTSKSPAGRIRWDWPPRNLPNTSRIRLPTCQILSPTWGSTKA